MDYLEDHIQSNTNDFESKAFEPIRNLLMRKKYYDNYDSYFDKHITYTDEFFYFHQYHENCLEIILVFKEVIYNRVKSEFVVAFDITLEGNAKPLIDESQNVSTYCDLVRYDFSNLFEDKSIVKELYSYLIKKWIIKNRDQVIDELENE